MTTQPEAGAGNPLTAVREFLRDLCKGIQFQGQSMLAYAVIPPNATPPFIYAGPNDPYLDLSGSTFGDVGARFQIGGVTGKGTNETRADELDELLLSIIRRLQSQEAAEAAMAAGVRLPVVEGVGRPGQITLASGKHLAVPINVRTSVPL